MVQYLWRDILTEDPILGYLNLRYVEIDKSPRHLGNLYGPDNREGISFYTSQDQLFQTLPGAMEEVLAKMEDLEGDI